ncbi:hypothetical protein [Hymenobacter cellulosivorans]|uniref:Uncharacterized protein n=1 Tax=Hymenobacter cellulosivorans TaxID=2932249 RepID=A0ABY4FFH1_9BACT|nr:hypothetical protein [Hymenobacter cellulosivorans]UOQ54762.1 hypothetical protein MUN80_08380 [Hymenobacter cellulosivorans]
MKKILLLTGLALSLCGSPALAQTSPANTAVVRVTEWNGTCTVVVSYGVGKTELLELQSTRGKQGPIVNAEQLQGVFDKLLAAGYVLQGTFSGPSTGTLIFRKP